MRYTEQERATIGRAARVLVNDARGLVVDVDEYAEAYGFTACTIAEYTGAALDDMAAALGALYDRLTFDMACDALAAAVNLLYA